MLLKCGATPQQAVDVLLNDDSQSHKRQFALVDGGGRAPPTPGPTSTTGTGGPAAAWAAAASRSGGLAAKSVVDQMVGSFEGSSGSRRSSRRWRRANERAVTYAANSLPRSWWCGWRYGSLDDRHVVISIYDHPRPIDELARCYALHRLSYFPSEPSNLVPVGPEIALELKSMAGEVPTPEEWTTPGTPPPRGAGTLPRQ